MVRPFNVQRFALLCGGEGKLNLAESIRLPFTSISCGNVPNHIAIWFLKECVSLTDFASVWRSGSGGYDGDVPSVGSASQTSADAVVRLDKLRGYFSTTALYAKPTVSLGRLLSVTSGFFFLSDY